MSNNKEKPKIKSILFSNIPNLLTITRFLLTFVVVYFIFSKADIRLTIAIFVIAALTDFFDGIVARKFHWTSEFGRRADMIADRFLWVGTALAFIVDFGLRGLLSENEGIALLLIMTRELISAPFVAVTFFSGNPLPQARYIAKVTTFIQGFALPSLILSIDYPVFSYLLWPTALAACITGFYSAMYYINDIKKK